MIKKIEKISGFWSDGLITAIEMLEMIQDVLCGIVPFDFYKE